MSGLAGEFAGLYSSYLEVPPHFFYMAFLTCLGAVLADRLTLASEIAPQPLFYTILLGESADDRKSTAIHKTIELSKYALTDFNVVYGIGSAEGLQTVIEKAQALIMVCFDEFKQFIGKCNIDSSVLLPCVNSLFELNHYENCTKKHHVKIDPGYLSMLAASTVQTYASVWSAKFTNIGFNNRLFLVPGSAERRFFFLVKYRIGKSIY